MKRSVHRLPALLAVIVTVLVLAACGDSGSSTAQSPEAAPATDSAATPSRATASSEADAASEPARADDSEITIKDFEYLPPDLEISAGTEVTWTNEDFFGHTVTAGEPGNRTDGFDGTLGEVGDAEGETFSHTFDEPGTYRYFCRFHPDRMQAVVTVTR